MDIAHHAVTAALNEALAETHGPVDRAILLQHLVQDVYDYVKHHVPGGEGWDGLDGPERRAIGEILAATITHRDITLHDRSAAT